LDGVKELKTREFESQPEDKKNVIKKRGASERHASVDTKSTSNPANLTTKWSAIFIFY